MDWLEILRAEAERTSRAAVARAIGMAPCSISGVLNGNYPGGTTKVAARVMATFAKIHCPHLDVDITRARCAQYAQPRAPISSPAAVRHWRACQSCPLRPVDAPPTSNGAKHGTA